MSAYQTYHVPEQSRLAICAATSIALTIIGAAGGINSGTFGGGEGGSLSWYIFWVGIAGFLGTLFGWFRTTINENLAGMNSPQLKKSYVLGMFWFITSEVFFFMCFFGALFYLRTLAGPWLGGEGKGYETNRLLWEGFQFSWPMLDTPQEAIGGAAKQVTANTGTFSGPHEDMAFPGFAGLLDWIPFWNTAALLTSSLTVHIAHTAMKNNQRGKFNVWLGLTLLLGFIFVALQAYEYHHAYTELGLTLAAGIYGSTFFILTGFHGFHVCMGALMLSVQWLRSVGRGHFSAEDQFGFEASSWYWHFVDVVWVGLVLFVYVL